MIRACIFILVVCWVPRIYELMAYIKFRKTLTSFSVSTYLFWVSKFVCIRPFLFSHRSQRLLPLSLACFVSACHLVLVFSALSFQVHWSFFNIESAVNSSSEFFISCFLFLWVAFDSCLCFPSFLIAFVFLFKSLGILLMTILWSDYLLILSSPSLLSQFHLIDFPLGSESPFPHGYYV